MFYIFFLFSVERCLAEYLEKYLNAMNNTGKFYRRPLAGQSIRYGTQAIGIYKLKTMMKFFFSETFLFLEIVILTMTSWTWEGTFFSYLEVANCCVKQCVNKKISNLFILFSAFLETSIACKTSFSGITLFLITSRSGSYCTAVTSCSSTLRMGIKRYCTTEKITKHDTN